MSQAPDQPQHKDNHSGIVGVNTNISDACLQALFHEDKQQVNPDSLKAGIIANLDYGKHTYPLTVGNSRYRVACITPDDKCAALFNEAELVVIDLENKTSQVLFQGTGNYAPCFMDAIDDNTLISVSRGGNVRTWNFREATQAPLSTVKIVNSASCAALSSDRRSLVIANNHIHSIEVMDIASGTLVRKRFDAHNNPIYCLAVTQDMKYIVSGSDDHSIKIWTFDPIELVCHFVGAHPGGVTALQVTNDGKIIASGCTDGTINLWDFEKKKKIDSVVNAHEKIIESMSISSDGELLFSASLDGTVKLWNIHTKAHLHTFRTPALEELWSVATTKNGRFTIGAGDKGAALIIDIGAPKDNCMAKKTHTELIDDLNLTPDGALLVSGGDDGILKVWDVEKKEMVFEMQKENGEFWKFAICCDNDKVATGCSNGEVDLWSLKERKRLFTYSEKHVEGLSCVRFTKNGTKLLACAEADGIYVHDAHSDKLLDKVIDPREDDIFIIDTTSDDRYYVSGSRYKSIAIWDAKELKIAARIENAHDGAIWSLRLTSDDRLIISGATDAKVKAWDFQTRKLVYLFDSQHVSSIRGLDISRDSLFVISSGDDGFVEVHNLKLKQRVFAYSGQQGKGERSLGAVITNDNQFFFFSTLHSLFVIENPMRKLAIQSSDEVPRYPLIDSMPLTSFFTKPDIEHRRNLIISYPDLKLHPCGWNWFHITAIFAPDKDLVRACLDSQIPFKVDMFKKTALHYLIDNKESQTASINIVLAKFGEILSHSDRPFEVVETLTDIVPRILEFDNVHVSTFLKCCFRQPESASGGTIDTFGKIMGNKEYQVFLSDSMYYSNRVRDNLIIETKKHKVSIQVLPFHWDYSLSSDTMNVLVKAFKTLTKQELFKDKLVGSIIDHLWNSSMSFYYLIAFLWSIQTFAVTSYINSSGSNLGLEVLMFAVASLLSVFKFLEIIADGLKKYLHSSCNRIDLATTLLVPIALLTTWTGLNEGIKSELFGLVLATVLLNWSLSLRIFSPTRDLVRMTLEMIRNTWYIALILISFNLGLTLIFLQGSQDKPISASYQLTVSQLDLTQAPWLSNCFLVVIIFFAVMSLNILSNIMRKTFSEFQSNFVVLIAKDRLRVIETTMRVRRGLKKFLLSKKSDDTEKKYLFFAEQVTSEDTFDCSPEQVLSSKIETILREISLNQAAMIAVNENLAKINQRLNL